MGKYFALSGTHVPAPPKWEPSQGCLNYYIAVCTQIGGSKPPPYDARIFGWWRTNLICGNVRTVETVGTTMELCVLVMMGKRKWNKSYRIDWYQFAPKVGAFYKVRTTTGYPYVLVMRTIITI